MPPGHFLFYQILHVVPFCPGFDDICLAISRYYILMLDSVSLWLYWYWFWYEMSYWLMLLIVALHYSEPHRFYKRSAIICLAPQCTLSPPTAQPPTWYTQRASPPASRLMRHANTIHDIYFRDMAYHAKVTSRLVYDAHSALLYVTEMHWW